MQEAATAGFEELSGLDDDEYMDVLSELFRGAPRLDTDNENVDLVVGADVKVGVSGCAGGLGSDVSVGVGLGVSLCLSPVAALPPPSLPPPSSLDS